MVPSERSGITPLYLAVLSCPPNEAMVTLLLDKGAAISATTLSYRTIQFAVTMSGTTSIVQLLLHRGADPTIRNDGATLLHCAAQFRTAATVRLILDAGLDIEAKNKWGLTALHCAINLAGRPAEGGVVKALLEWGANIHATDDEGLTPLQTLVKSNPSNYAAHTILNHQTKYDSGLCEGSQGCVSIRGFADCDEPIVDYLLSAGANIWASSNSTQSPWDWAASHLAGSYGSKLSNCG
jgi:ankyrin repeat protein